jgi:hypothetical protein
MTAYRHNKRMKMGIADMRFSHDCATRFFNYLQLFAKESYRGNNLDLAKVMKFRGLHFVVAEVLKNGQSLSSIDKERYENTESNLSCGRLGHPFFAFH